MQQGPEEEPTGGPDGRIQNPDVAHEVAKKEVSETAGGPINEIKASALAQGNAAVAELFGSMFEGTNEEEVQRIEEQVRENQQKSAELLRDLFTQIGLKPDGTTNDEPLTFSLFESGANTEQDEDVANMAIRVILSPDRLAIMGTYLYQREKFQGILEAEKSLTGLQDTTKKNYARELSRKREYESAVDPHGRSIRLNTVIPGLSLEVYPSGNKVNKMQFLHVPSAKKYWK